MSEDSLHSFSSGSNDDVAEFSCLTEELENYLYVHGFAGECSLGALSVPPANPMDPPGATLDALVQYWLQMDRRRYSGLPFFVRKAKVQAAYERERQAIEQDHIIDLKPPYTRQTVEDIRRLFELMDAYDRIMGIQNRVRRLLKSHVTQHLTSNE